MNTLKIRYNLGYSEFNLKDECVNFIKGQRNSGTLSKLLFKLKTDIPNLSNHEALEILLDHNERIEKKDELNQGILKELKRIFFR